MCVCALVRIMRSRGTRDTFCNLMFHLSPVTLLSIFFNNLFYTIICLYHEEYLPLRPIKYKLETIISYINLNDMQIKYRFLFVLLMVSSFMACDDDKLITGDNEPLYNHTYLRFVSSTGTNVLDSLSIMSPEKWVM